MLLPYFLKVLWLKQNWNRSKCLFYFPISYASLTFSENCVRLWLNLNPSFYTFRLKNLELSVAKHNFWQLYCFKLKLVWTRKGSKPRFKLTSTCYSFTKCCQNFFYFVNLKSAISPSLCVRFRRSLYEDLSIRHKLSKNQSFSLSKHC